MLPAHYNSYKMSDYLPDLLISYHGLVSDSNDYCSMFPESSPGDAVIHNSHQYCAASHTGSVALAQSPAQGQAAGTQESMAEGASSEVLVPDVQQGSNPIPQDSRSIEDQQERRQPLQELKNYLQVMKPFHFDYLKGRVDMDSLSEKQTECFSYLKSKGIKMNRQDYLYLYQNFEEVFTEMLYSSYLQERIAQKWNKEENEWKKNVYIDHLFVFEKAIITRTFPRINHIRARGRAYPGQTSNQVIH